MLILLLIVFVLGVIGILIVCLSDACEEMGILYPFHKHIINNIGVILFTVVAVCTILVLMFCILNMKWYGFLDTDEELFI